MSAWQQDQHKLFRQYLGECSIEDDLTCEKDAFERSVDGATGSGICSVNTGGSAWFWFTVMSTVGYGNQAPVTAQGRSLVSGLSWLCTALFGGISLVAGGVIATLSDDLFRRYHLAVLTKHSASVAFWAAATVLWLVIQATIGYAWWKDRSPEVTFTRYDSLWWSYISLTTVGLGDYFLEPETMFTVDVFLWSLLFFIGFVTVTTFLNKVTSWLGSFYTHTTSNLKERMARSDPLSGRVSDYKKTNKEALHDINALVDMMGSIKGHDNIGMTLKKRKILIRLLAQTEHELEDFSTLGGVSPSIRKEDTAALKKEEDILSEILSRIRLEQRLMQESSRSKVDTDSERLSNYSGGAVGHVDVRSGAQ
ncbi:ion channel [Nitzschia inconspicua]|uniref:Ion channel n=1 Tax=Nitzschia inconspicua TaxID=303405 RepID=A0A9K3PFQ0_9STRA|nr:ion channel [Nitzschia inconspicua]